MTHFKMLRARVIAALVTVAMPGMAGAQTQAPTTATATVKDNPAGPKIDRHIFSQFAEHLGYGIYDGIWVGPNSKIPNTRGYRNDVLAALRELKVPLVRWPGGCFADEYHWREGIGPRGKRPIKINTNWGGVTETNAFGTHEFMDFAELIGAEAYVSGNVGSGSPQEMAEWVEYMTSSAGGLAELRAKNGRKTPWKLPYFGIGNELWGCGGNMRAEFAVDQTRLFGNFIKVPQGTKTLKIASGASTDNYKWTEAMMSGAHNEIDGVGVHYYTVPNKWENKGSATQFDEEEYATTLSHTLRMEELLTKHGEVMDKYDPAGKVMLAVDEWGTWYDVEPGTNPGFLYQQNSLRDAMVAALNLNIFMRHAQRVKMTNIAQMVNVLQAMILTRGKDMVLTPTYHVFDMYKGFQDATLLDLKLKSGWYARGAANMEQVSAVAARGADGVVRIALTNVHPSRGVNVSATLAGLTAATVTGQLLTAPTIQSHNEFDKPAVVKPQVFTGAQIAGDRLDIALPARAIVVLELH